jgi:hypothetical protein
LDEAAAICDDTIDSQIDLHIAMLAQGFPYDLELPDEDLALFEGTGTGEIIASIRLFFQKQEAVTVSSQGSWMNGMVQVGIIRAKDVFI